MSPFVPTQEAVSTTPQLRTASARSGRGREVVTGASGRAQAGDPFPDARGPDNRARARAQAPVAVAVILLAWFALANLNRVRIDFWVFHRDAPLIVVILISGLLGALITALIMRRKPREPKQ